MREEMKRFLTHPSFWLAMGGMLFCLLIVSVPNWIFIDLPNRPEWRSSALVMAVTPVWFGGYMLMLPFCCAIASVPTQVEDLRSGFARWQVIRSSVKRYVTGRAAVCTLGGFLVGAVPFWLHAAIWHMIALPVDPIAYPEHELYIGGLFGEWYDVAHGLPMMLWIGCGAGLCGSMTAMMGLAAAAWIPDRLIAVTLPAVVIFFWAYDLPCVLFGIHLPRPAGLYNDGVTWEKAAGCLLMNGMIGLISLALYVSGVKRRMRYA